jgi:hypothetical protein
MRTPGIPIRTEAKRAAFADFRSGIELDGQRVLHSDDDWVAGAGAEIWGHKVILELSTDPDSTKALCVMARYTVTWSPPDREVDLGATTNFRFSDPLGGALGCLWCRSYGNEAVPLLVRCAAPRVDEPTIYRFA